MFMTEVLISLMVLILEIFSRRRFYFCLMIKNWLIHVAEQMRSNVMHMIFKKKMNEFLEDLESMSDN